MISKTPLITVVTPTHNRAYIIESAVKSVLSQTYTNFEYIIVNDFSTDTTDEVVKNIHDPRIKYVQNKRSKGLCGAWNTALDMAKGDWITFIDDDDEWYPNLLEVMIENISSNKDVMFAIPRGKKTMELYDNGLLIKEIDNSNNYPDSVTIQDITYKNFRFDNIGLFLSKKVIDDGLRFDEDERVGKLEGWEFALQLCEKYPHGLLYVKDRLFHYHQRYGTDGRVSNDTYSSTAVAFEYIYQKHKNDKTQIGQSWYPERVEKYNKFQKDLDEGKGPPKHLQPFA